MLEDDLVLVYSPDTLTLKPGGKGTVEFIFSNSGNETQIVKLTQMVLKCAGASSATIDPDFFELLAGETTTVVVIIQSSAHCDGDCYSDSHIAIAWGQNLTLIEGQNHTLAERRIDESTVDGGTMIIYPVNDDLPPCYLLTIGSIIVAVVVIVIVTVVMYRRKGRTASIEDD